MKTNIYFPMQLNGVSREEKFKRYPANRQSNLRI
jgi:hypothetical protein